LGGDLGRALNPPSKKELNLDQWHCRYRQQARWTADLRHYLFTKASLQTDSRVLEAGVGTGAILDALKGELSFKPFGVDINRSALAYARRVDQDFNLVQADGGRLPLPTDGFDLTYCHYLLLWVANPTKILIEMQRVTRPGGFVIALAEPDHQSRIDYPPPLDEFGKIQTESLAEQGADTALGRRLRNLFTSLGFAEVEAGVLGAQWSLENSQPEKTEWMMIQSDLEGVLSETQLAKYQNADQSAHERGERVLFIPTFYAAGRVNSK
jgi:ubiquinone/menaquinone biosynthesis C-methylase UbiE